MLSECSLLVRLGYDARCSFGVRSRYASSHDALFRGRLSGRPTALGPLGRVHTGFSVWTIDQLECGNVGAFQPRL